MQADAIKLGQSVIVVDDLIATGEYIHSTSLRASPFGPVYSHDHPHRAFLIACLSDFYLEM